jgi:hypothetical protein
MRLLSVKPDGTLSLSRFTSNNIPKYAILSHTWEVDDQEVTFQDLIKNNQKGHQSGYRKIQFCGDQAKQDGLQYFWIDSCCIDQSSSAELSTAINSMYRWYRNAAKCYVYLSDVSTVQTFWSPGSLQHLLDLSFNRSRWFTRGWTLQELLAPLSVEFFSKEGIRFGDKKSLEIQIQQITGIPLQALRGHSVSRFSIKERMLWIANRITTVEEDLVYSLLGIFEVHMPQIYGEGILHAMRRLGEEIERSFSADEKCKLSACTNA